MTISILEPFFVSALGTALAEIGDKTQILVMVLAACYCRPKAIIAGVFLAALASNFCAAAIGHYVVELLGADGMQKLVGAGLIVMALWMLRPEKPEQPHIRATRWGVAGTAFTSFFLGELGDKTQIATMALAARYENAFLPVALGATLGLTLVSVPAVYLGTKLTRRLPLRALHIVAAVLYAVVGVLALVKS